MKPWQKLHILAKVRFVLGAGAGGCLLGAVVALLIPPLPWVQDPLQAWVRTVVRIAHGVGLGWWAGVFWGALVVFAAGSWFEAMGRVLPSLGLGASAAAVLSLVLALRVGLSPPWSLVLSCFLALAITRLGLALARRDHR